MRVLLFFLLLLPTFAPVALASPAEQIAVVPGALLPALSGSGIERLAAYAASGEGEISAIPFQVDERDPGGRYVVDRAVDGTPADLPRDDGRFDANDEAVFNFSDAGVQLAVDLWPSHRAGMEVELTDPSSNETRFVYILEVATAPNAPRRDVHYDSEEGGRVEARYYNLAFGPEPLVVRSLEIKPAAGGDGTNLVHKSKYKAYSRLTPYLLALRIKRDDDDVVATVLGYREGPVRLIRLVRRHTNLVLGLATPQHVRTEIYSAAQAEWHEEIGYSLDMKRLVARSVVETMLELTPEASRGTFLCEGGGWRSGQDEEEGDFPLDKAAWWGVNAPGGALYVRYTLFGEAEQKLLFDGGKKAKVGWQADVMSMGGRIRKLRTRFVFPHREIAGEPARIPWMGAPDLRVNVRPSGAKGGVRQAKLSPSGPAEPLRIKRRYDVILLTGYDLKSFLGLPVDKLRLYAARGGKLEPVVFQVDERDSTGRYVLPEGEAKTSDVDSGLLDDNDEIVSMADRLGDRVDRSAWPAGIVVGSEIAIREVDSGETGWFYLFAFDDPPPRNEEKLVRRDGFDEVMTDVFTVAFPEEMAYFDHFTMKTAGKPDFSDNLVDRLKIRFRLTFKFLYIPLPYRAGEDDFERRTIAYRDGPVRLIFRQDLLARLTFGVKFHMEPSDWVFYENQAVSEVIVKNPFLYTEGALKRVKNAHFLQSVDLDRSAAGMRFYNSENPEGVVIDGRMSKAEKELDARKDRWIIVSGEQAHSLVRVLFLDDIDPDRTLVYVDDKNKRDRNDRDYGQWGNAGYDVDLKAEGSVVLLTRPSYTIMLYFYQPPDFDVSRKDEILDILDKPLEVRIGASGTG